jgi:hypothetical protein
MKRIRLSCLLVLFVSPGGCSEFDRSPLDRRSIHGWSQVRLPAVPREQAFDAAVQAMGQWFRVAESSPALGQVRSAVQEFDQRGGTDRLRDAALKYKNRMRRTATLVIVEEAGGCRALCEVRVERLDTSDHRVFRDNQRFTDYPNQTPIDSDAAVSTGQSQVWTEVPRDRQLESHILAAVRSRLFPTSAPGAS